MTSGKSLKPRIARTHVEITHNGKTMTIRDWADESGISYHVLYARYFQFSLRGNDLFKEVRPILNGKLFEYQGESHTLSEWGRKLGIPAMTLVRRQHRGDTGGRLFRPIDNRGGGAK